MPRGGARPVADRHRQHARRFRCESGLRTPQADFGRLIGILTSRDLLRAFAGRVHPSEARVREWMTAEPVTVSAATPIEAAVTLMTEYGFHHLPVIEDERPAGMLGLRQATRQARGRTGIGLGF